MKSLYKDLGEETDVSDDFFNWAESLIEDHAEAKKKKTK